MSAEATGWVYKHSPMKGAELLVHLALADTVNDIYGNEFWMTVDNLAAKARVARDTARRALRSLEQAGLIVVLEQSTGRAASRYEMLMPDGVARAWEPTRGSRGGSTRGSTTSTRGSRGGQPAALVGVGVDAPSVENPREEPNKNPSAALVVVEATGVTFEAFWSSYPRRNGQRAGKVAAQREWSRLKPCERNEASAGLPLYAKAKGEFPEDAERYLKHRRWVGLEERSHGSGMMDNVARLADRAARIEQAARGAR